MLWSTTTTNYNNKLFTQSSTSRLPPLRRQRNSHSTQTVPRARCRKNNYKILFKIDQKLFKNSSSPLSCKLSSRSSLLIELFNPLSKGSISLFVQVVCSQWMTDSLLLRGSAMEPTGSSALRRTPKRIRTWLLKRFQKPSKTWSMRKEC